MTEAFYKVGDILEFKSSRYFPERMDVIPGPFRALIIRVDDPGYEYVTYRLLMFSKECNNFINRYMSALQKDIITSAKRIGHIDISLLRFEEKEEPDYAMFFTAATIAQAADLRNENEKLKAENKALSDTLSKSEAKAQSRLDRNEVLKRENEELRGYNKELEQALSKSEEKAHSRLDEISSLMRKVNELENVRDKLKAERDEANHEIDRLRTVIGGLNDVINDLNDSKSEISELFSSLKTVLQTDDILEGVNKLKKENERLSNAQRYLDLSNENRELKALNDELRKSIPEYNGLALKYFACTEKIKKLEDENARYLQSMTCAEKQMTEAAQRIHEAMEHLNVALCNN